MRSERHRIERERHNRALWYAIVAFSLAAGSYLFLGFDQTQALGYAISCFVMLNLVNFRTMFARLPAEPVEKRREANQ